MINHVLLLEDNLEFQTLVKRALGGGSIKVTVATSSAEALQILEKVSVQLILLDVNLPKQNGFEFFSYLQNSEKYKNTPVIFLTGESDPAKKVAAFSLGAEDYIVKPFDVMEFRARVEARLKKSKKDTQGEESLWRGNIHFNLGSQRVYVMEQGGERELELTSLEFKLLFCLARKEDQVFTREQLLSAVWGDRVQVVDRTIDTHISSLRKKLGPCGKYIESVFGTGYRFRVVSGKTKKKAA